jgi:hypothetical protein
MRLNIPGGSFATFEIWHDFNFLGLDFYDLNISLLVSQVKIG